jgi:Ser/Thr protein kinase RdoA (MazF antagonist)
VIERLQAVGAQFRIDGEFASARPHGSGHIHDTFAAEYRAGGRPARYVLQRLNTGIFGDPAALCDNVARITAHQRRKLELRGATDRDRRCLRVVETRDGGPLLVDGDGGAWRAFRFIAGTRTCDTVEGPGQAYRAARAFGEFAADLADLPGSPLAVTIPDFHDLAKRVAQLQEAVRCDAAGRAVAVAPEIASAERGYERLRRDLADAGCSALPARVMHNDCKLNNLLLDAASGEALCVIDLDTVMEATLLCDFGELVRSATCRSPEDERNLASMTFDRDLFAALSEGYLAGGRGFETRAELDALPLAGPALTLENAVRFLADYLAGDVYFRIHRDGHNLDRSRAQLRLFELLMEHLDDARAALQAAEVRTSL